MYSRLSMMDKVAELMKKIGLMIQTPVSTVIPVIVVETSATSIASREPSPLSGTSPNSTGLCDDSDAQQK
jgi:hypothetical protein